MNSDRLERLEAASCKGGLCSNWETEYCKVLESEVWNIFDTEVRNIFDNKIIGINPFKYTDGIERTGQVKTVIFKHRSLNDRLYSITFDAYTDEPSFKYQGMFKDLEKDLESKSCHWLVYRRLSEHKDMEDFIKDVESLINNSGLATTRINIL